MDPQLTISGSSQRYSYRQEIYDKYLSQRGYTNGQEPTESDYRLWAAATRNCLKGWLPLDHSSLILDIGCGPGNFLFLLNQLGYTNLTGVDLSPEQIALAHKWCPNAAIVNGDIRDFLAQQPGHFELIGGLDIIEHFGKDEILPLLTLVAQALRPGGRLILQTPNGESPWMGPVAYGDFTHEWFFTPQSLKSILSMVGLSKFEARPSAPYVHGTRSLIRAALWKVVSLLLATYSLAETGSRGSGIYTRVFLATAVKQ